jgi:hypothetical protein
MGHGNIDNLSSAMALCIMTSAIRERINLFIYCSLQSADKYTNKIPKFVDFALGFMIYWVLRPYLFHLYMCLALNVSAYYPK